MSSADLRVQRFQEEGAKDYRTAPQIDRDRVLYSTAFARLAEVTQVVPADSGHVFHNRLTHSLKVAQIARRMAERMAAEYPDTVRTLGGIDADAAEAAALAHDLGHPPFGHLAEEELDRLCRDCGLEDGFEGNAQSFRIVTVLAIGDPISPATEGISGLNLTRGTLNALLKYPWLHSENPEKPKKWGAYQSEKKVFEWVRAGQPFPPFVKCVEAELMDWADDITFSVHDLIDFFCAGRIPLEQLAFQGSQTGERDSFFEEVFERNPELCDRRERLQNAFDEILNNFPLARRYTGSQEQRRALWQFITILISRYVSAISLDLKGQRSVCVAEYALDEVRMLKELTWHYVILHQDLATIQRGQREMVTRVFKELRSAAANKSSWNLFPPFFRNQLHEAECDAARLTRITADYVSSMTERELGRLHRLLTGC